MAIAVLCASVLVPALGSATTAHAAGGSASSGRILLGDQDSPYGLYAVRAKSTRVKVQAVRGPGGRSRLGATGLSSEAEWVSPDGTLVLNRAGELGTVGSGAGTRLGRDDEKIVLESADFSPDGTRLVYAKMGTGQVIVRDLASGTSSVVLDIPCARYSVAPGAPGASQLCGEVRFSGWLDPSTLFVWHFAGPMPERIDSLDGKPSGPRANTYSIVGVDGTVAASAPGKNYVMEARGSTVLLGDGWLDVDAMRAGNATPQPLPGPRDDVLYCLPLDGSRLVVQGTPWEVIELRTGKRSPLGTTRPRYLDNPSVRFCAWSPDGRQVAVKTYSDDVVTVVPISKQTSRVVTKGDAVKTMNLLAWVR